MGIYMEAFQHFVWATRKREHFVTSEIERVLFRYIQQQCKTKHVHIYALNGMPDHVHLVTMLPAAIAPADFMHDIKGGSHIMSIINRSRRAASTGRRAMAC